MDIRVLGPVEASAGGKPVFVGAGKPRALLALLALNAGSTISTDRLVEGLWGEEPPATAAKMVQLYVSQLRKALSRRRRRRRGDRHARARLRAAARRRRAGCAALRAARRGGRGARRAGLWRGAPLADVADEPFAAAEIRRLEELRRRGARAGDRRRPRPPAATARSSASSTRWSPRSRCASGLHAQRMLALYRCGPAGGGAGRLPRGALGAGGGDRRRARPRAAAPARGDPAPGPALEPPAADAVELPPELDAGTPLVGREAELDGCASSGGARTPAPAGSCWSPARAGSARRGWRRSSPARCIATAARCSTPPGRRAGDGARGAGERSGRAAPDAAGARRRRPRRRGGGPRSASWSTRWRRCRCSCWRRPRSRSRGRAARGRDARPRAAGRRRRARGGAALRGRARGRGRTGRAARRGERRRAAAPAPRGGRVGAHAGRPPLDRHGRSHRGRAPGAARGRGRPGRATSSSSRRRASAPSRRPVEAEGVVACPFKGLASFDVDDAGVFFGRERLVAEMVARLTGAPLMGIVGPSGSGKSSALRAGLLAALAAGVLPGSERWALALLRPGEHPLRALEQATAEVRAARPARGRGRPVRGAVHGLPRRVRARGVRRRARRVRPRPAPAYAGAGRRARRLLRSLRRVPGAVAAAGRQPRAGRPDAPRRAAPRDRAARPPRRAARRARAGRRADRRRRGRARRAAAAVDVAARAVAAPRRPAAAHERLRARRRRARRGRAAGRARLRAARPRGPRVARAILLRLAGEGEGDASCAAACRWPSSTASATHGLPRSWPCSPTSGWSRSARARWRSRTRRCCASGRACAAGSRRTPRAAACTTTSAPPRATGTPAGRDPGELYRGARLASALDWIAGHEPELNELERAFVAESRAATEVRGRAPAPCEPAPARAAGRRRRPARAGRRRGRRRALPARRGSRRGAGRRRPAPRRRGAQRRPPRPRAAARARRRGRSTTPPRRAATCSRCCCAARRRSACCAATAGRCIAVAVSPDERLMAIGDERGTVTIFDGATRRPLRPVQASRRLRPARLALLAGRVDARRPQLDPRNGRGRSWTSSTRAPQQRRLRIVRLASPRRRTTSSRSSRSCRTGATWRSCRFTTHPTRTGRVGAAPVRRTTGAVEGGPLRVGRPQRPADHDRGSPAPVRDEREGRRHLHDRARTPAPAAALAGGRRSRAASAPTGGCSRSARREARSACSTCAPDGSGRSAGATTARSGGCGSRPTADARDFRHATAT